MTAKFTLFLSFLLTLMTASIQRSAPESKSYYAAVVEFYLEPHVPEVTSMERVLKISEEYANLIESEEAFLADIVVFPEGTFNDQGTNTEQAFLVPDPSLKVRVCDSSNSDLHPAFRRISCSARDSKKYVTVDVAEKFQNSSGQMLFYNTNVVFDRSGILIARYRKFNLFNEPGFSITPTPELSVFHTDFNVTFGQFICFDIYFKSPALDLLSQGITDFVYPTMWFSEMPFLSALQAHNMWAAAGKQVNLLVAGVNNPRLGNSGTGIFSKNGALLSHLSGKKTKKIFVAEVPKREFWNDFKKDDRVFYVESLETLAYSKDYLNVYATKPLDVSNVIHEKVLKETLCHGDLCCNFEVTLKETEPGVSYHKRFVVFDGVRGHGDLQISTGIFVCAMISCANDTLVSCGDTHEETLRVHKLRIQGKVKESEFIKSMPNTMDYSWTPLTSDWYRYTEEKMNGYIQFTMELRKEPGSLYTFGVYGRNFAKDGMKTNSAETPTDGKILLLLFGMITAYFIRKARMVQDEE